MKINAATIMLLASSLAISSGCMGAQSIDAAKQAKAPTYPYSSEETSELRPSISRRDLDLRAALTAAPDSPELLYAYALVLRQEGKARDSLAAYTHAASLRKPTAKELRSVALDYVMLSDYDDAIHWLELAAQSDPHDAEVLYSLGRCYYSKDRYQDARRAYDQVLAIQPKHLKAEENLGLVYDATNEPVKAEVCLRKAASWADAAGPDDWPFLDLGSFLLDHNQAVEAIRQLRIAVRIKPGRAESHEKLGRALLATHDASSGIAELRESIRLQPENPRTHYELGRAFRQAGQTNEAQEEFKISQKLYAAHSQE